MPLPANGTERDLYIAPACAHCRYDHSMHDGGDGPGCTLYRDALFADRNVDEFPEWPEVEPMRPACSMFEACGRCGVTRDDIPERWREALDRARELRPRRPRPTFDAGDPDIAAPESPDIDWAWVATFALFVAAIVAVAVWGLVR